MFGSLGVPELLLIFAVALIVFGPRRLPDVGRSLARALNEFKKASNDLKSTLEQEVRLDEEKKQLQEAIEPLRALTHPTETIKDILSAPSSDDVKR